MKRYPAKFVSTLLLLLLLPAAARAQSVLPDPGDRALSFSLPSGGGYGFGLRWMRSDGRSLGLDVTPSLDWRRNETDDESETTWALSIRPELRLYRGDAAGPVVPFAQYRLSVGYSSHTQDRYGFGVGADVGIGVEWFPLEAMSVSGSTGLGLDYSRQGGGASPTTENVTLQSFRSELRIALWY